MTDIYSDVYDYNTLEAAYNAASEYFDVMPDNPEEWLINLQNHLMWRSYKPYDDDIADCVILEAISIVITKHGIKIVDTDPGTQSIIKMLTQV